MAAKPRCPSTILDAIPWYPSGLGEAERGAVEAHAADCHACRSELGFVLGAELPREEVPDPERVFARVVERIEKGPPRPRSPRAEKLARAASLLAAALVGSVVGWASVELRPASWTQPFSAASPASQVADATMVDVVFRAEASAAEIQRALQSLGAHIVSGPDEAGVYRLRLAPGSDLRSAEEQLGNGGGVVRAFGRADS